MLAIATFQRSLLRTSRALVMGSRCEELIGPWEYDGNWNMAVQEPVNFVKRTHHDPSYRRGPRVTE